jgi:hypothetical protein
MPTIKIVANDAKSAQEMIVAFHNISTGSNLASQTTVGNVFQQKYRPNDLSGRQVARKYCAEVSLDKTPSKI